MVALFARASAEICPRIPVGTGCVIERRASPPVGAGKACGLTVSPVVGSTLPCDKLTTMSSPMCSLGTAKQRQRSTVDKWGWGIFLISQTRCHVHGTPCCRSLPTRPFAALLSVSNKKVIASGPCAPVLAGSGAPACCLKLLPGTYVVDASIHHVRLP